MAEIPLGVLMREIGEALKLDNDDLDKVWNTTIIYKIKSIQKRELTFLIRC